MSPEQLAKLQTNPRSDQNAERPVKKDRPRIIKQATGVNARQMKIQVCALSHLCEEKDTRLLSHPVLRWVFFQQSFTEIMNYKTFIKRVDETSYMWYNLLMTT